MAVSVHSARTLARRRAQQQVHGKLQAAYARVHELESEIEFLASHSHSSLEHNENDEPKSVDLPAACSLSAISAAACSTDVVASNEQSQSDAAQLFDLYSDVESSVPITSLSPFLGRLLRLQHMGDCFTRWATFVTVANQSVQGGARLTEGSHASAHAGTQGADYHADVPRKASSTLLDSAASTHVRRRLLKDVVGTWASFSCQRDATTQSFIGLDTQRDCTFLHSPACAVELATAYALQSLIMPMQHLSDAHHLVVGPCLSFTPRHNPSWKLLYHGSRCFSAWKLVVTPRPSSLPVRDIQSTIARCFHTYMLLVSGFVQWYASFSTITHSDTPSDQQRTSPSSAQTYSMSVHTEPGGGGRTNICSFKLITPIPLYVHGFCRPLGYTHWNLMPLVRIKASPSNVAPPAFITRYREVVEQSIAAKDVNFGVLAPRLLAHLWTHMPSAQLDELLTDLVNHHYAGDNQDSAVVLGELARELIISQPELNV